MEIKLHANVEKILEIIKSSMRSEKMCETPENVVNAAITTFLEMCRRNDQSKSSELLQIVLAHKDYIGCSKHTTEFIRTILLDFRDEKIYSQGFRIIKYFINNGKFHMEHFEILLKDCFGKKSLKTKSILLVNEYLGLKEFRDELIRYILGLSGVNLVRHINCFFDVAYKSLDLKSKLDEVSNPELFKETGSEEVRKLYSECCDLIYKYTEVKMNSETPNEDTFEYIIAKLKAFFSIPLPRGDKLLKTFSLLSEKDFLVFLREKRHLMKLDVEIKKEIKNDLLESKLKNEQIYEFIRSVRHILIPEFIDLTRYMAEKHMKGDGKYYFALGAVVSIVGAEEFFELLDTKVWDIRTWAPIIRGSSNGDISFFMRLYQSVEEVQPSVIDRTVLLNCLPAFCNYASDHKGLIEMLLLVMKANISDSNVFSSICTGLNRLIHSHQNNIKNELILRNPIPIPTSQRILQAIHNSSIALDILAQTVGKESDESNDLLFKLMDMDDFGLSGRIFEYILLYPKVDFLAIGKTNLSDILDVLKIAKFFVTKIGSNFEIVSKLLELSLSDNNGIQKRAYQLLYHMRLHNKIDLCICDSLFSEEAAEKTKVSSQKWRASFIHLTYSRGCSCFPERKREYLNRMLPVLILNLKTGNIKARKICLESLEELVLSFDGAEFDFYCRLMVAGMNSENVVLRCGILEATTSLMENHRERLSPDFIQSIYSGSVSISRLGRDTVLHVLRFLSTLIKAGPINPEGCFEILELYADSFRDKYMKDIKDVIELLVDRDIEIPKKLRRFSKTKKVRGPLPNLHITKKNDVVITEGKKKESKGTFVRHRRTLRNNRKHKR